MGVLALRRAMSVLKDQGDLWFIVQSLQHILAPWL